MRKSTHGTLGVVAALCIAVTAVVINGCDNGRGGYSPEMQAKIDSMQTVLKAMAAGEAALDQNLRTFDTLDYTVFSNQEWVRLHESHAQDIVVNWPDGHHTNGIERHIEDLKAMFVYAPDTRIKQHPIRFGSGTGSGRA